MKETSVQISEIIMNETTHLDNGRCRVDPGHRDGHARLSDDDGVGVGRKNSPN